MDVKRGIRLQVFTVSPTDEPAFTCFETGGPAPVPCTTVISTEPDNSASTHLFMGGEAPGDAPALHVAASSAALTVAVYQSDARIAHAIIPLEQVWEVLVLCLIMLSLWFAHPVAHGNRAKKYTGEAHRVGTER